MNEIVTRITHEGDRQVVEIPNEFGVADAEVIIELSGDVITIRPKQSKKMTLQEALGQMQPLTMEEWPDLTDDDLGPLRDIIL